MIRYLKRGASAETVATEDAKIRGVVETMPAGIQHRGDAAVRDISERLEVCSRLCALKGFMGHKEQADIRVKRYGAPSKRAAAG